MRFRHGLGLLFLAACGGGIAPTDTFDDGPGSSSGSSGRPAPGPTGIVTTTPPTPPIRPPNRDGGLDDPPPIDSFVWQERAFTVDPAANSGCTGGAQYVRPSRRYGVWVGVELCGWLPGSGQSSGRYKIYLGFSRSGTFYPVADSAGGGQDHCELVSPTFVLPNEDDIRSGGCTACVEDGALLSGGAGYVFSRARFGEPFSHGPWPSMNYYSRTAYGCGVDIP